MITTGLGNFEEKGLSIDSSKEWDKILALNKLEMRSLH